MLNSTTWLYGAEVLPIALRSKVMGLAAASHFIVNVAGKHLHLFVGSSRLMHLVIVTEAGPSAFANIHENYYYVFVACSFFFLVVAYLYFPYVSLCPPKFGQANAYQGDQAKDSRGSCSRVWRPGRSCR